MNNIHVWIPIVCAVVGFVLGAVIASGCDFAVVRHYRRNAKAMEWGLDALFASCRAVLADSWYNKVVREYKRRMDALAAKKGGAK